MLTELSVCISMPFSVLKLSKNGEVAQKNLLFWAIDVFLMDN